MFVLDTHVISELRSGKPQQSAVVRAWVDGLLRQFVGRMLPFTAEAALVCAPMHVPEPRSSRDSMIAATAIQHGFTLVTRNVDDFKGLALKLVNPWGS